MATEVVVPAVGESITSVKLLQWLKGRGDEVRMGDVLAELETDKATMSLECPADGVVLATLVEEGEETDVGRLIAVIGAAGETWTPEEPKGAPAEAKPELRAAPSARRLARQLGIDIREVAAALGGKRVTEAHVREFQAGQAPREGGRVVSLSRIRTAVAERMAESARTIPQFSVSLEMNAAALISRRDRETREGRRVTLTALVVWAACRGIEACPMANARYLEGGRVFVPDEINMAVAVATDSGLVAPVIRDAAGLAPAEIAARLEGLVERARRGGLEPGDQSGATFTLSNLGALGAHAFTPMVVPGQSAILGVGAVTAQATITATLAADHRVLDGADAVKFLTGMEAALSEPGEANEFDFPISVFYDVKEGTFSPYEKRVARRLGELGPMYCDQEAAKALVESGDPLIYEIFYYSYPATLSDWGIGVSRIKPGKVGDEYHMTKGHFHERDDQPEVYFCTKGSGYLLMETKDGDFRAEPFHAGIVTHIPGHWAHRVVNTGAEDLSYIGVYSLKAGHSYDRVLERGFAQVVVERNGKPELIPNPRRG